MSSTSDLYERTVAKHINKTVPGLIAERPVVSTSYPDVRVRYKNQEVWVEIKMNHTDNLMNPRFQYENGIWSVPASYKSLATDKLADMLNNDSTTKQWIANLKKYIVTDKSFKGSVNNISLHSNITNRRTDKNSISLETMKKFLRTQPTKNFAKISGVDVGYLVTLHYTVGKAVAAYYVSAGDDFYQFGNKNPLKIPGVPKFTGKNNVVFRIGDRSGNFEIQAEVKLKTMAHSKYSVKPGSIKKNPFRYIGI